MGKLINTYCIKLVSNSNKVITNQQLISISKNYNLSLEFLSDIRSLGYAKIWFNTEEKDNFIFYKIIAFAYLNSKIQPYGESKSFSEFDISSLLSIKPISIPKNSVITSEDDLLKIKKHEERRLYDIIVDDSNESQFKLEKNIDFDNTICIEIRKYNQEQLSKIANQLFIKPQRLLCLKEINAIKVYWDKTKPYFISCLLAKNSPYFSNDLYKGLNLLNSFFSFISKKDKDRLLKINSFDFSKSKSNLKMQSTSKSKQKTAKISRVKFDIDDILDKISKHGINSLTLEERKFLDNESKKDQ